MTDPKNITWNLPNRVILPLEFHKETPFLAVEINGESCQMVLDTGAPDVYLNHDRIPSSVQISDITASGSGASGSFTVHQATLDTLQLGPIAYGPIECHSADYTHLEKGYGAELAGLIGFKQLIYYTWMVDWPRKELHLYADFRPEEHQIDQVISSPYANHLPCFPCQIGDRTYQLLLDTGASTILLDQNLKEEIASFLADLESTDFQGAGSTVIQVDQGKLTKFTVGNRSFADSKITFSDLSGLQKKIGHFDGIIGADLLSKARVAVSWEKGSMYFLKDN